MAETSLDVILRGQDRATGEINKAMKGIRATAAQEAKDRESLDRQIFNASASARDRELRSVTEHFGRLRQQYQGNADMIRKINQAQIAEVERIDREQDNQKFTKGRMKAMLGGFVAAELIGVGSGLAGIARAQENLSLRQGQGPEATLEAMVKLREAQAGLLESVPILGSIWKQAMADGTAEMQHALVFVKELRQQTEEWRKSAKETVRAAELAGAQLLGFTGSDQAEIAARNAREDRAGKLGDANSALSRAAMDPALQRGIFETDADRKRRKTAEAAVASARNARDRLEAANAEADAADQKRVAEMRRVEGRTFAESLAGMRDESRFGGPGLENRFQLERANLERQQREQLIPYEKLGDRRKAIDEQVGKEKVAVDQKWGYSLQNALRTGNAERVRIVQENIAREKAAVEKAHAEDYARLTELENQKTDLIAAQGEKRKALTERQARERRETEIGLELRAFTASLTGETLNERQAAERKALQARHALELPEGLDAAERERRLKIQEQERRKLDIQQRRETDEQEISWLHEALQARLGASRSLADARARDLADIEEDHRKRMKLAGEDWQLVNAEKKRYQAAKDAATKRHDETDRTRETNLRSDFLRAGGQGSAADLLLSRERFRQAREEFADNNPMLNLLGMMQRKDEAVLQARMDWGGPNETASHSSSTASRIAGYESPMRTHVKEIAEASKGMLTAAREFSEAMKGFRIVKNGSFKGPV